MKPIIYDNLLTRAHVRTFNLHQKMEAIRPAGSGDPELQEILSINEPLPMFTN
jgi:CHASE3 domain sensor protein